MFLRAICVSLLILTFSSAKAEVPVSKYSSQEEFIISEFEKLLELELIDCLIGWDTAIHQAENGQIDLENIPAQRLVVSFIAEALERKTGEAVGIKELRSRSSFHVSGIYLTEGDAHSQFQEKVMQACVRQIWRINERAKLEAQDS